MRDLTVFDHVPGHPTTSKAHVVGGSDFPDRTYYRNTLACKNCGWEGEDYGDARDLLLNHLIHALRDVLSA
jgi:hypothetical protein